MKPYTDLLSLPLLYLVLPPCFIGYQIAGAGQPVDLLWVLLALALLTVWGSMLNHYADWQADELNHKRAALHRAWRRTRLLRYQWAPLLALLAVIGIGLWGRLGLQLALGVGIGLAAQYSCLARLKDRLGWNYLYLALVYGLYPLGLGWLAGGAQLPAGGLGLASLTLAFLLLIDLGIAPSKDYEDCTGDLQSGKRTLPNVYGPAVALRVQTGLLCLAALAGGLILSSARSAWWWPPLGLALVAVLYIQKRRLAAIPDQQFHATLALASFAMRMSLALAWMQKPF